MSTSRIEPRFFMKKISCIGLFICLFASAQAQVFITPKAGISFGRYTYSSFTKEDKGYIKDTQGPVAGIAVDIPLFAGNFFSLQPELCFIQKGYRFDNTDALSSVRYERTINFLELPVLAKVTFGNKRLKAYLNAGPSIGYALGGQFTTEAETDLGDITVSTSSRNEIKFAQKPANYNATDPVLYYEPTYYNAYEVAAHVGGGIGFRVGPGLILLDARYSRGLTTFNRRSTEPARKQEADGRSRNVAFTVGYAILLGGQ